MPETFERIVAALERIADALEAPIKEAERAREQQWTDANELLEVEDSGN